MEVKGSFKDGKMYRGNGRWAKVMVTKMVTRPSLISISFGLEGEFKAFDSRTFDLLPRYQKSLDGSARNYVETGSIWL